MSCDIEQIASDDDGIKKFCPLPHPIELREAEMEIGNEEYFQGEERSLGIPGLEDDTKLFERMDAAIRALRSPLAGSRSAGTLPRGLTLERYQAASCGGGEGGTEGGGGMCACVRERA